MIQKFKLYKWKDYAWAVYDAERKHHDAYAQDLWLPSFYQFLEKFERHSTIDVIIADEKIDNPDFVLTKAESEKSATKYGEYYISNRELSKLFPSIPQTIFMKIHQPSTERTNKNNRDYTL